MLRSGNVSGSMETASAVVDYSSDYSFPLSRKHIRNNRLIRSFQSCIPSLLVPPYGGSARTIGTTGTLSQCGTPRMRRQIAARSGNCLGPAIESGKAQTDACRLLQAWEDSCGGFARPFAHSGIRFLKALNEHPKLALRGVVRKRIAATRTAIHRADRIADGDTFFARW